MIHLWPFLLPIATGSGWYFAKRQYSQKKPPAKAEGLTQAYVVGLNYLLDEQTDKAVDIFIKLLDVDSDTVETHLALGSLFRRRGEINRATRIHQNLIARPKLSREQKLEALMALAKDYMCAGVYDRAERTFKEVANSGGDKVEHSLRFLLSIYEQEKSWLEGLEVIERLETVTTDNLNVLKSHYYCELVLEEHQKGQHSLANVYLNKALSIDKKSVRASLLQGELEHKAGRYKNAIKAYQRICHQDDAFIGEVIHPLNQCYSQLGQLDEYRAYLKQLMQQAPRSSIVFVLAQEIKEQEGTESALDYVSENLNLHPSLKGLNRLIKWYLDATYGKVRGKLKMLYKITSKLVENKPIYRCGQCGFSGKHLHWQCPGCREWSTIKPICGLEGD